MRYKPYLLSLIILIIDLYIFAILSNITTGYSKKYEIRLYDPLTDIIGLDNEEYTGLYRLTDLLPFIITIISVIINIYYAIKNTNDYIIEAIFCETITMFLKGIFQIMTILPDANPNNIHCEGETPKVYSANLDSCGNMIWSGHMTHTILGIYWIGVIIRNMCNSRITKIYWLFGVIIIIFEGFMIVCMKIHYTVDVVLSVIFVPLLLTNDYFWSLCSLYKRSL